MSHDKETKGGQIPPPVCCIRLIVPEQFFCFLLEKLQNSLRHLIGLRQHGLCRLNQDVVLGVCHHLFGNIYVADSGLSILDVLSHNRQIIDGVELKDHIGVCLDTCHIYDAGYDIVGNLDAVLKEFDEIIGLERLKAIHLNDSKNPFASHKDRHEKIGEGSIGVQTFNSIINNAALKELPFYLETPNEFDGYAKEIALLKSLYTCETENVV